MSKRSKDIQNMVGCITIAIVSGLLVMYLVVAPLTIVWLWPLFHTQIPITYIGAFGLENLIIGIIWMVKS